MSRYLSNETLIVKFQAVFKKPYAENQNGNSVIIVGYHVFGYFFCVFEKSRIFGSKDTGLMMYFFLRRPEVGFFHLFLRIQRVYILQGEQRKFYTELCYSIALVENVNKQMAGDVDIRQVNCGKKRKSSRSFEERRL